MQAPAAHVALFVDFANLRLSLAGQTGHDAGEHGGNGTDADHPRALPGTRDIARSLVRYTETLGRLGVARAYADWSRIPQLARQLTGTRLAPVLVPATEDGEDRSHIKLAVDAVECLFNGDEPDAFVLVSGDPTLVPLVQAIRADGSEVVIVASASTVSEELREEADHFVSLDSVLDGEDGESILPRAWRTDRPQKRGEREAATPAEREPKSRSGMREQSYTGPRVVDAEFANYDWGPFIRLIDELENRLPFVGVRYLVNKVLGPHNCGIDDPRVKRDLINEAVDEGVIEMYSVGNVDNRTDPVTACRLDRENDLVSEILGEAVSDEDVQGDDEEAAFSDGISEDVSEFSAAE